MHLPLLHFANPSAEEGVSASAQALPASGGEGFAHLFFAPGGDRAQGRAMSPGQGSGTMANGVQLGRAPVVSPVMGLDASSLAADFAPVQSDAARTMAFAVPPSIARPAMTTGLVEGDLMSEMSDLHEPPAVAIMIDETTNLNGNQVVVGSQVQWPKASSALDGPSRAVPEAGFSLAEVLAQEVGPDEALRLGAGGPAAHEGTLSGVRVRGGYGVARQAHAAPQTPDFRGGERALGVLPQGQADVAFAIGAGVEAQAQAAQAPGMLRGSDMGAQQRPDIVTGTSLAAGNPQVASSPLLTGFMAQEPSNRLGGLLAEVEPNAPRVSAKDLPLAPMLPRAPVVGPPGEPEAGGDRAGAGGPGARTAANVASGEAAGTAGLPLGTSAGPTSPALVPPLIMAQSGTAGPNPPASPLSGRFPQEQAVSDGPRPEALPATQALLDRRAAGPREAGVEQSAPLVAAIGPQEPADEPPAELADSPAAEHPLRARSEPAASAQAAANPAISPAFEKMRGAEQAPSGPEPQNALFAVSGDAPAPERAGVFETASAAPARPETTRPETARQVAVQIAETLRAGGDRTTELRLQPEELGRVSMALSSESGMLSVTIVVDRPETLDLMRRHVDALAEELRRLGYDAVDVTLTGGGKEQGGSGASRPPGGASAAGPAATDDAGATAPAQSVAHDARSLRPGGMDIRL